MPTSTVSHSPAPDPPTQRPMRSRKTALAVVVASIATLGIVYVVLSSSGSDTITVQSIPAQPTPASAPTPVAAPPAAPAVPSARPAAPPPPQPAPAQPVVAAPEMDAQGFVDSARCDSGDRAVAIARTELATMVVCEASDGAYEYRGVRLRDGASLELDDVRPMAAGFEARNEGTTYRLSPTELVVLSGESLQSRDTVLDYRVG